MTRIDFFLPVLSLLAFSASAAHALEQLVPAGSVIACTVAEPKISSKTEHIGDPILCRISHTEVYGRTTFPYGSYLVGTFEDYKDPGHFVGKGYMELKFDRMVLPDTDTVIPISARVVSVPKYPVDADGRIHGTGHAVKDSIEWLIPVLWPLDVINLARRGPRPVLKPETRLILKVLDDFGVPSLADAQQRQQEREGPALITRREPSAPAYNQAPEQQPISQQQYAPPQYNQPPQSVTYVYNQPPPQQSPVIIVQSPPQTIVQSPPVYRYPYPPPPVYGYPYGQPVYYGRPGYYRPY